MFGFNGFCFVRVGLICLRFVGKEFCSFARIDPVLLHVVKVANNCFVFVFAFGLLLLILRDHRVSFRWIMDQETILRSFADAFGLNQINSCPSCIRASLKSVSLYMDCQHPSGSAAAREVKKKELRIIF